MRLGFLLSRPLTQEQLEAWLGDVQGLDPSTLRTVQLTYVGRPVFSGGLTDPMPVRSGVLRGLEDVVPVPDDLPAPRKARSRRAYVPPASEITGSSEGLLDCPALDEVLAELSGEAGSVRNGLGRAAWAYIRAVGSRTDVAALTARLTEEGLKYRSPGEVADYGIEALVRWWLARAPADDEDELEALPDFGPARADRTAAIAELHTAIAQEIVEAAERVAWRRELARRVKEAVEQAAAPFGDPKLLDLETKRRRNAAVRNASRQTKAAYLAELGREKLPRREAVLHTGAQGSGKTRAVVKGLAGLKGGNVLVLVPTLDKAEEFAAELEKQIELRRDAGEPVSMFVKVWRGRLAPSPGSEWPPPKAGVDLNRPSTARMCSRPKDLIGPAQRAGVPIRSSFCKQCPMQHDCAYLLQLDTLKRLDGRLVLIAAADMLFVPRPLRPDLVVIDEAVISKVARAIEIAPERLLDPEKWDEATYATDIFDEGTPLLEIAQTVAQALAQGGQELKTLQDAGIDDAALEACQQHLNGRHEALVGEVTEAAKAGTKEARLKALVAELEAAELRSRSSVP